MPGFNSSKTPLANGATWSSNAQNTGPADYISGMVFADKSGKLYIEQSSDGTNWDISKQVSVTASTGTAFDEKILGSYFRIRFTNDSGQDQTAFRISSRLTSAGPR